MEIVSQFTGDCCKYTSYYTCSTNNHGIYVESSDSAAKTCVKESA